MNEKEVRQILMDWDLSFTPIDESVKKICDIAKLHEQARVDRIFKEIEEHFKKELDDTEKQHKETLYEPLKGRLYSKCEHLRQILWHFDNDVKWQNLKQQEGVG